MASLAHPTWLTEPERLLAELVEAGLDGIETYYGAYDEGTVEWLRGLGKQVRAGADRRHRLPRLPRPRSRRPRQPLAPAGVPHGVGATRRSAQARGLEHDGLPVGRPSSQVVAKDTARKMLSGY